VKRREFIAALGSAAAWPIAARAQQTMPVIGLLDSRTPEAFPMAQHRTMRQGLKETGFVEGENVRIEYRWGDDHADRVPELAADLVRRRVTVIATTGGEVAAFAVKAATSTIPVVFLAGGDPVRQGLVSSIARPEGNLTGVSFFAGELAAKRLELLLALVPGAARIAVLVDPSNVAVTQSTLKDVEEAARAIGMQYHVLNAASGREIDEAFASLRREHADVLLVAGSPFFNTRLVQLAVAAGHSGIPAMYVGRQYVEAGGLMSYGASLFDAYRQQGVYLGRILKGAKPSDLPVMLSSKFELVVNNQTARTLGLAVPQSLLVAADMVIE
jgi:putative tryptophan/tyrosine transport system substrate-binding protein